MNYSLIVLTYNAEDILEDLRKNIDSFTRKPSEIIIVDSASGDKTVEQVQEVFPDANLLAQPSNVDFCKGYNIGIQSAKNDVVLTMNQRALAASESVEHLLKRMNSDERIAAVGPKLLQMDGKTIDSMGIVGDVRRHFSNRGEGEEDSGQYDNQEVFGISGACMLLRVSALEDIAHPGKARPEYLDEDFVAYKDDVDLAYRLRHRSWKVVLEHEAVVRYQRNTGGGKSRLHRSKRAKNYSLRNHWWTLLKNEPFSAILRNLLQVLFYESLKFTFITLTDPRTIVSVVPAYFKKLPKMLKKRQQILSSSTAKTTTDTWLQ
jgi:GT2 family glycosyltransferase